MLKPAVVVVGSLNADLTLPVDHLPRRGETVLASSPGQVSLGGKGANQAAAAAAFGANVTMIGRVGDDDAGLRIRADLAQRGIDAAHVTLTPGARTGGATIPVERGGDNLIVVDPGANVEMRPADLPLHILSSGAALMVQLEIPVPVVVAAIESATGPVLLNPAPATALPAEVLHRVDVLVPNVTELALLTGAEPPASPDAAAALAGKLDTSGDIVVTLGAAGALVIPRAGDRAMLVSAPDVSVLDTTGAGDCFCGTLAASLAAGLDLVGAVRLSVAAASISTTGAGARGKLPGRPEAESLATSPRVGVTQLYGTRL